MSQWISATLVGLAMAIQVLLAIDRWVHRQSDLRPKQTALRDDFEDFRDRMGQRMSDATDVMQGFIGRADVDLALLKEQVRNNTEQIRELWKFVDRRGRR